MTNLRRARCRSKSSPPPVVPEERRHRPLNAELIERGNEPVFTLTSCTCATTTGQWPQRRLADFRQRFFGVLFLLWYRLMPTASRITSIRSPREDRRRSTDQRRAEGYDESQRDQPNGFTAEKDIMDTWATSS